MITALLRAFAGRPLAVPGRVPEDVAILRGRWLPALSGTLAGMKRPAAAVTLGRTIILHEDARLTMRLLRHELAHVEQWKAAPWTFPVRYAWQHLRCGYRDNPYEVAARAAEQQEPRPVPGHRDVADAGSTAPRESRSTRVRRRTR